MIVITIVVLQILLFLIRTPHLEWPVVGHYLFSSEILRGVATSLEVAAVCFVVAVVIGTIVAAARIGPFRPLGWVAAAYSVLCRSIPLLVALLFWFNLAYLTPTLSIGVPFGPAFHTWKTNDLVTVYGAAIVGLSIFQGAYISEIIRAGLLSVDQGQRDAARAIGLTPAWTFSRILMPQALRVIIPPLGSQAILLLQGTSLVSVIGLSDLLFSAETIYNSNFQPVPLLLVASLWYLALITVMSLIQRWLEKICAKGYEDVPSQGRLLRWTRPNTIGGGAGSA
jgi:polar amino acid transport system permease protein